MNFVSWAEFFSDVHAWERQLPYFDAVCGVPRSGLFPASILAMRRNIRCIALADLLEDPETAMAKAQLRETNPAVRFNRPVGNKLLLVDDAVSDNMVTFSGLMEKLKDQQIFDISYGTVYATKARSELQHVFRYVAMPRMFGWNWYRHWWLQLALLDMDGVICEDWRGVEQKNDPSYLHFLDNAKPLYLPEVKVRAIVTGRLEVYRRQTEAWLSRHNVQYGQLIMYPGDDPAVRRKSPVTSEKRKAAVYKADTQALLFVESDRKQSQVIHQITQRPVLCVDTQEMFKC